MFGHDLTLGMSISYESSTWVPAKRGIYMYPKTGESKIMMSTNLMGKARKK